MMSRVKHVHRILGFKIFWRRVGLPVLFSIHFVCVILRKNIFFLIFFILPKFAKHNRTKHTHTHTLYRTKPQPEFDLGYKSIAIIIDSMRRRSYLEVRNPHSCLLIMHIDPKGYSH